jgi:hypothetical protein
MRFSCQNMIEWAPLHPNACSRSCSPVVIINPTFPNCSCSYTTQIGGSGAVYRLSLCTGYGSANMDRIEVVTGRSTLPLHPMSFPSPSLPDSSELPPRNPSSDLRLPSVSNGSTANIPRGERGISEGRNSIRSSATSKRPSDIELACPVYKSNPEGPHPKRCERGSWKMISRLKHVRKFS